MPAHKKYFTEEEKLEGERRRVRECQRRRYADPQKRKTMNEATKKHYNKNYHYWLQRNYGISIDQYNEMLNEQNFKCAICGGTDTRIKTSYRLSVDHCHSTGKIRGLLCNNCNTGLGRFDDDKDLLSKAITYLNPNKYIEEHAGNLSWI